MAKSTRSSSTSESAESTLSEFLARRRTGEVPVFGGNPFTGAREFGRAMYGSTSSTDVVQAISSLTSTLQRFSNNVSSTVSVTGSGPITMVDLSTELTTIEDACKLDESKIELLLSASMIRPEDTKRYATLLATARTSLIRKRDAMLLHAQRKSARIAHDPVVRFEEIDINQFATTEEFLRQLLGAECMRDDFHSRVCIMALLHDSVYSGRETNRVLAHIGDSVLKVIVAKFCLDSARPVSDVSDMVQAGQMDVKLAELARVAGLHNHVIVARGVDPNAKKILATAVEALVGAAYFVQGYTAALTVADKLGVIVACDIDTPVAQLRGISPEPDTT